MDDDPAPEKKPRVMPMSSTSFSRTAREGRGDTSAWTDSPSDTAEKAKMNYFEAYNQARALWCRSTKNKRLRKINSKKNSKQEQQPVEGEWLLGIHPWKPWDRETDPSAELQNVEFDAETTILGLASKFSSGSFQRNFL